MKRLRGAVDRGPWDGDGDDTVYQQLSFVDIGAFVTSPHPLVDPTRGTILAGTVPTAATLAPHEAFHGMPALQYFMCPRVVGVEPHPSGVQELSVYCIADDGAQASAAQQAAVGAGRLPPRPCAVHGPFGCRCEYAALLAAALRRLHDEFDTDFNWDEYAASVAADASLSQGGSPTPQRPFADAAGCGGGFLRHAECVPVVGVHPSWDAALRDRPADAVPAALLALDQLDEGRALTTLFDSAALGGVQAMDVAVGGRPLAAVLFCGRSAWVIVSYAAAPLRDERRLVGPVPLAAADTPVTFMQVMALRSTGGANTLPQCNACSRRGGFLARCAECGVSRLCSPPPTFGGGVNHHASSNSSCGAVCARCHRRVCPHCTVQTSSSQTHGCGHVLVPMVVLCLSCLAPDVE